MNAQGKTKGTTKKQERKSRGEQRLSKPHPILHKLILSWGGNTISGQRPRDEQRGGSLGSNNLQNPCVSPSRGESQGGAQNQVKTTGKERFKKEGEWSVGYPPGHSFFSRKGARKKRPESGARTQKKKNATRGDECGEAFIYSKIKQRDGAGGGAKGRH